MTNTSPLQYQKKLRLQEARRLMFGESLDVATAGFSVGYGSPSQFSREYGRLFGAPPDFERSLVGVRRNEGGELEIWGIVHSGSRWLRVALGGRERSAPLPPVPVVRVEGPGRLTVSQGSEFVAELAEGRIAGSRADIFPSRWLRGYFAHMGEELRSMHEESRLEAEARGEAWAQLDPELPRMVARRMYLRLFATLSEARHGATIVNVPPARAEEVLDGHVSLKHTFADGEHRRRLRDLIVDTMNGLAQSHSGEAGGEAFYPRTVGWHEYSHSEDRELDELDESISEFAHLVSGLAAVDGAVVMTDRGELLGFGGEISGELEPVFSVEKALDPEGETTVPEDAEAVGTRHRSAYRLAAAVPDALMVVVSQDGNIRYVADVDGAVTCWDQA